MRISPFSSLLPLYGAIIIIIVTRITCMECHQQNYLLMRQDLRRRRRSKRGWGPCWLRSRPPSSRWHLRWKKWRLVSRSVQLRQVLALRCRERNTFLLRQRSCVRALQGAVRLAKSCQMWITTNMRPVRWKLSLILSLQLWSELNTSQKVVFWDTNYLTKKRRLHRQWQRQRHLEKTVIEQF